MTFLTLDLWGLAAAALMGLAFLYFGGFHIVFILFMLYFLALSALVTFLGKEYKKGIGVYEKSRGVPNVLSNAGGPIAMALVFKITSSMHLSFLSLLFLVGFAAGVAAITADKFSSEVGVLDGTQRSILTFEKTKKGTSGSITAVGLGAGLLAAVIISLPFAPFFSQLSSQITLYPYYIVVVSVAVGGFFGTIIDSLFGYFEERGHGDKFTSNLVCGVLGGFLGMLIFALLV